MFKALFAIAFILLSEAAFAQTTPYGDSVLNQAVQARAVTPNDSTALAETRALFNGNATACNIAVIFVNDTSAVTFSNVQSGALLPFAVTKVMSTNTTCSSIVALY
jgi:hypothetical protein